MAALWFDDQTFVAYREAIRNGLQDLEKTRADEADRERVEQDLAAVESADRRTLDFGVELFELRIDPRRREADVPETL